MTWIDEDPGGDVPARTVVALDGEIDCVSVPAVTTMLLRAIAEHPGETVVVDLHAVTFLDSSGLRALVNALKVARASNGELQVVNVRAHIARAFTVTGLDQVLDVTLMPLDA